MTTNETNKYRTRLLTGGISRRVYYLGPVYLGVLAILLPPLYAAGSGFVLREGEHVPFVGLHGRLDSAGIIAAAQSRDGLGTEQYIAIIRACYDILEDYARSDVADLQFQLEGFKFLYPENFPERLWVDIATLPHGLVVDMTRSEATNSSGVVSVRYRPKWSEHEAHPMRLLDGGLLESATITDVMKSWEVQAPEYVWLEAITTFQVTVSLRGEARTYQAAFLWYPDGLAGDITFIVLDNITQGVAETVLEPQPPMSRSSTSMDVQEIQSLGAALGGTLPTECQETTSTSSNASSEKNSNAYHLNGNHYGRPLFTATCECTKGCDSKCRATVQTIACADSGVTLDSLCHKMSQGQRTTEEDRPLALSSGETAVCTTAFGCAATNCVAGCTCLGVTVTGTVGSAGASIAFGSGALWTADWAWKRTCPVCEPTTSGGGDGGSPDADPGEPPGTPIIVDLGGHGLRLTSPQDGVFFDLDPDGVREKRAWTVAGAEDAFLALDRNDNGVIDDGEELFGNFTVQPESFDPNGFLALAMYDAFDAGGNEDGLLTAQDAIFPVLLLWTDSNHDGISQRTELAPLSSRVAAVELDYQITSGTDRHGNAFRYLSKVHLAGGRGQRRAVDVLLLRED